MLKFRIPTVSSVEDLHKSLQFAIELEHATLPTYLCALFSLKENTNTEIAAIIRSVVIEEMLHMTLAANIMNAIGGHPAINKPAFIPKFPGPLPMGIGDEGDQKFIVPLKKFSKQLVFDVFMKIEEPEKPIEFPKAAMLSGAPDEEDYSTIGEFYTAIAHKIETFGPSIFNGDPNKQVTRWFDDIVKVTDASSALKAIHTIVSQGEGNPESPLDLDGKYAHYYRFSEIYYGKKLVKDSSTEKGYSYSGETIPFDPAGVWNMIDNPHSSDFKEGSIARRLANQFNYTYSSLLNALHNAFNGDPDQITQSMGLMYGLRLQAQKLMSTSVSDSANAGPTFEYTRLNQ